MRTEIQKKFLIEHGMDPEAEGSLIDNILTGPKFLRFEREEKAKVSLGQQVNAKEEKQKMQEENQAMPQETKVESPQPMPVDPVTDAAPVAQPQPSTDGFGKLDASGQIEKQKFDPTPFIGQKSFIEYIEERKGQYGYYIKLYSQVIDESSDFPIRASTIFGLEEDKEGKIGWPSESKLDNFLKKFNVTHYRDLLVGATTQTLKDAKGESYRRISGGMKTQVVLQTHQAKDGNEYLTF